MTTMTGTLCRVLATALIVGACNSDRMGPPPPPPAAAQLVVAGLPSPSVTGSFANVEVIAEDAAGHDTIVSYRGTVRFTSTDPAATLPSDYTFVPTDSGRHGFTVIFETPGLYSVTATDVATSSITGADTVQVTSAPPPPGLSKQIVFSSDRTGTYQLYAMDTTGANQHQIATTVSGAGAADVSPDGSRLVFATSTQTISNQIWVMNADGSGQTQLNIPSQFDYTATPSWSPDGSKIAFGAHDWTNGYQVFVMSATGTGLVRLAGGPYTAAAPRWSPDGSKIVYISDESGPSDVWVMNSDGSQKIRLTSDGLDHLSADFSPDGTKILFTRRTYPRGGGAGSDIWVMDADGTNQTNVSRSPAGTRNPHARWAFGGGKILFTTARDGNFEIYVMNADGSNPTNLTNNPAVDLTPAWAK